jgi:hypothetical protein
MKSGPLCLCLVCLLGSAFIVAQVSAQIVVGNSEADHFLYFYEDGSSTGEFLQWVDIQDRFAISDALFVGGDLVGEYNVMAGAHLLASGHVYVNYDGPDGDSTVYFYEGGQTGRYLQWDDSANQFNLSDALATAGPIQGGSNEATTTYSRFCAGSCIAPESNDMSNAGDLHVVNDAEVGGTLYLNRSLFMEGDATSPPDGDQTIYFADALNRSAEYIRWDASEGSFRITDDIHLGAESEEVSYGIRNNFDLMLTYDANNNDTVAFFRVFNGNYTYEALRIVDGNEADALFDGTVYSNGLDYAEAFRIDDPSLEAGDVVALQLTRPEYIRRATSADEAHLLGVISAHAGFVTGRSFDAERAADGELATARAAARATGDLEAEKALTIQLARKVEQQYRDVALAGRLPVKVDGSYGAIEAGDYLTASPTPGHAMVLSEPGAAIGIALEPWTGGPGAILAFIQPRWYGGGAGETGGGSVAGEDTAEAGAEAVGERAAPGTTVVRDGGSRMAGGPDIETLRVVGESLAGLEPVIENVEAGDVLVADRTFQGWMRRSEMAADPAVVGVVTEADGVVLGDSLDRLAALDDRLAGELEAARAAGDGRGLEEARAGLMERFGGTFAPVAMSGIVRCKVDASYAAIEVGDLLATSPTPGHAMRAEEAVPGTILGKALEAKDDGTGRIRMLVMLR